MYLWGAVLTTFNQKYVVSQENFDSLTAVRHDSKNSLGWECLFTLPEWLKTWWGAFNSDSQLNIFSIRKKEELLGLAPLQIKGGRASFIGGVNVCDYLDFIVAGGREDSFYDALLDHLSRQSIQSMELGLVRPDSTVLAHLVKVAEDRGCQVSIVPEDIALELELPATWEDYLGTLNGKQRHEVKRKLRRLNEAGNINLRIIEAANEIPQNMATFFELFKKSSSDKAAFLTDQILSFFQALAIATAKSNFLKLYILELDAKPIAASMCFDFNATLHLYNSGFDPRFRALSAGLLCKVLSIKDGIKRGRQKYDFLKGAETYKYRLGGKEIPLYRCEIRI